MSAVARAVLGLALLLGGAGCQAVIHPPEAQPDGAISWPEFDGHRLAHAVMVEANRVRAAQGVPLLYYATALDLAADEQATQLVLMNTAGHSNIMPGEETATARVRQLGVEPAAVAENALMEPAEPPGISYRALARRLIEAWMNSPGHRANLLNPHFTCTGGAARLGHTPRPGRDRVYAVQVFLLPAPRSPTVRPVGLR